MKTKEDLLKEEYGKLVANPHRAYATNPSLIEAAHIAMSEYAKQQAIAFAAYIGKINVGKIAMPGEKTEYDWEELYPHFIEYQSQNK